MPARRKTQRLDRFWRLLAVIVWVAAIMPPGAAMADITYDDGATHPVSGDISDVNETVGATSAGVGTTVTQGSYTSTLTGNLTLGRDTGSSGNYELSGAGSLSAQDEYVGASGTGAFSQSGGTNTVGRDLFLGRYAGSNGTYTLTGGSLSAGAAGATYVGFSGSGAFTQTGGTNNAGSILYLGFFSTGSGAYDLQGGSLLAGKECIGYYGNGVFTQSGGTNTISGNLEVASFAGTTGIYNLSNGSLSADNEYIGAMGDGGTGTFNQSGGTNTIYDVLYMSYNSANSSTYNLSGGSLAVGGMELMGYSGTSTFTQNGGTHTASSDLYVGVFGTATYNLSGGSLAVAGSEYIGCGSSGVFTQSGGTHTASLIQVSDGAGTGAYDLSGGSLTAGTVDLNSGGLFNQTGGSLTVTTFNQQGGEVQGSLENRGTFNYDSGTFSGRLLNYGTVNLNANFTAANGLANYAAFNIDSGRTVTLNGSGLDNQGSLAVNGTLDGSGILAGSGTLLNNTGGTLSGSGTILGNLTNSGTVNPGNSPGTLTIAGDYTQTASGALTVEIASASSYDILNVTGAASLNGTLRPVLLGGYRPVAGQTFSGILTAGGGVSGTFSTVTNFTPTLVGRAIYTSNSVDLLVARDYTNSSLNLTPNQRAVGNMLNGLSNGATGDLNQVLNTIDGLGSGSEVANAYQQISPDKAASLANLGFAGANLFRQGLANRITNLRYGGLGGGGGLGGLGGLGLSGSRLDGLMLAYNSSNLAGLITAKKKATPETPWGFYLDPGLVLGSQKSTINQTGYNFTIAGFTAGADYRVTDDLLVGLATGYSHTGADFRGSGGSVENNTWPLTAYAAYLPESFYAYGSLGYALNLFSLERQLSFGDLSRKASSSPTGHQFNAYGEAGYDVKANALVMTPLVSLAYSRVWVARFTESGAGSLNLEVASQQVDSLQTGVGAKIAVPLKRNGVTVVPQVYATYQHEFSHNSRGLDARLSQGSTFTFQTEQLGEDFAVAGASVTIMSQKNFSLQLNYNAEVGRAHYTAHTINTGVRWEF